MTQAPMNIGILGCGNISKAYLSFLSAFPNIRVAACADLDLSRAQAQAAAFNVPKACSPAELLADPTIELVVNLTIPRAHAQVNLEILRAGKHAYVEKPFALDRATGAEVLAEAARRNLRVGCAPDTVLGGGLQTCRKLIDDGLIGRPLSATAFMAGHGHESWHPDPEFYYDLGGGPMLDMGPYYLTALVQLLGPARRVGGATRAFFPERTITSEKKRGQKIPVKVPTHYTGFVEFQEGAVATLMMSFDVWSHHLPCLEVHGELGSIAVPDPNRFDGEVLLFKPGPGAAWQPVPHTHNTETGRGLGVVDMAAAIRSGRPHRAHGHLAHHVLDIMLSFEESSCQQRSLDLTTTCERPTAMPPGLAPKEIDP
jgi:predicted dehydrogenase